MAFKYINPGYGSLWGQPSAVTVFNSEYNPTNGVAFHHVKNTPDDNLTYPSSGMMLHLPPISSSDIYMRFDFYAEPLDIGRYPDVVGSGGLRPKNYSQFYAYLLVSGFCGGIFLYGSNWKNDNATKYRARIIYKYLDTYRLSQEFSGLVSVYYKFCSAEKKATLIINDEVLSVSDVEDTIKPGQRVFFLIRQGGWKEGYYESQTPAGFSSPIYISNLIISDKYISPKEQVVALSASATETNMTADESGLYIADAANQSLWQSVDVDTLIENYGESSAINGIALIGNPAYKEKTDGVALTSLVKGGLSTTEHGFCYLPDSNCVNRICHSSWFEHGDTAINDLRERQFGWQVRA